MSSGSYLLVQLHFVSYVRTDNDGLICSSKDGLSEDVSDGYLSFFIGTTWTQPLLICLYKRKATNR